MSNFFNVVNLGTEMQFSQTWTHEATYTDSVSFPIPARTIAWLELRAVMRTLDGEYFFGTVLHSNPGSGQRYHFSGSVLAPGREGILTDEIRVQMAPITPQLEKDLAAMGAERGPDQIQTISAKTASAFVGCAGSRGTDVTNNAVHKVKYSTPSGGSDYSGRGC
ncbi:hypothetical protein [Streptomyces sp. NPDC092307]|uniref:hypothetical protein n=1 Tax=Streptomyces sp. NPDC092307 TaxID=3366013 RepID=UPI00380457E0